MEPVLLFRTELTTKYELKSARKHFRVETSRVACGNCLVVARYSILPFYEELVRDLAIIDSRLINGPAEHRWIANFEYYDALKLYTPRTWFESDFARCQYKGPFVVKGRLKSRKFEWDTQMFAKTKRDALRIAASLKRDPEVAEEGVVFRRYVPLRTLEVGRNGLPYANEWRFFYLGTRRLSYGFYWSLADCLHKAEMTDEGLQFADHVATTVAQFAQFFVLDVAQTEAGPWILIEINDGQMSELSENDPDVLYAQLRRAIS